MLESLVNAWPVASIILAIIYSINLALSGLYTALEFIKDKTKTDVDNKIHNTIFKLSKTIQSILDFVGYNPKH